MLTFNIKLSLLKVNKDCRLVTLPVLPIASCQRVPYKVARFSQAVGSHSSPHWYCSAIQIPG